MINFKKAILRADDSHPGKRPKKLVLPNIMRMSNDEKRPKKQTANNPVCLTMATNSAVFDGEDTNPSLTPATKAQSPTTKGSRNTNKKNKSMGTVKGHSIVSNQGA